MTTLDIDTRGFKRDLYELGRLAGQTTQDVVRGQARLLVRDLIRLTPPFGKAPGTEGLTAQRAIGSNAVRRDIRWGFRVPADTNSVGNSLLKYARQGRIEDARKLLDRVKSKALGVLRQPNNAAHREIRDSRGRVRRTERVWLVGGGVDGYTRKKMAMVGYAKSGWGEAAAKLRVRARDNPSWIRSHNVRGLLVDQTNSTTRPTVTVGNLVPYIQREGAELRIVQRALRTRERNLRVQVQRMRDALVRGGKTAVVDI